MRYRAVAVGVFRDGKELSILSESLRSVDAWAAKIAKAENVPVRIYEREWTLKRTEQVPDVKA